MFHSTREILEAVRKGILPISRAEKLLKLDALAIVGEIARLDFNRSIRRGVPEIIYSESKTSQQLNLIVEGIIRAKKGTRTSSTVILSRLNKEKMNSIRYLFRKKTQMFRAAKLDYFPDAALGVIRIGLSQEKSIPPRGAGRVALLAAGTSDIYALNEAEAILREMRCRTLRFNDVGVAALRRLEAPLLEIQKFDPDALIVAAGMEAALPSLIAGLSSVPVIGLPTSIGFGYGGKGEAALMSMLQACPLGISVVNIDGGVAAGVIASLIANRCAEMRNRKS